MLRYGQEAYDACMRNMDLIAGFSDEVRHYSNMEVCNSYQKASDLINDKMGLSLKSIFDMYEKNQFIACGSNSRGILVEDCEMHI